LQNVVKLFEDQFRLGYIVLKLFELNILRFELELPVNVIVSVIESYVQFVHVGVIII
jgi:hypothetical protein